LCRYRPVLPQRGAAYASHPLTRFSACLDAYEARGLDTDAIRQWCIPELDGHTLVEAVRVQRPKRILEVGTYVGVSTLQMALADATAIIVTVDPNLAIATEMGSMNSDLGRLDGIVRSQDIARAAVQELFEDRIRFVEGGFAVTDRFSSIRVDSSACVLVVGPTVCAEHGSFDLIFLAMRLRSP
jgi:hypothetical protein